MTLMLGFFSFRNFPAPEIVPPPPALGGMTIEEYAKFSVQRDRIVGRRGGQGRHEDGARPPPHAVREGPIDRGADLLGGRVLPQPALPLHEPPGEAPPIVGITRKHDGGHRQQLRLSPRDQHAVDESEVGDPAVQAGPDLF